VGEKLGSRPDGAEQLTRLRDWEKKQAKGAEPSGRKLRMEKTSFSFSFSNVSNAFSNGSCNPFLLEIKTNQS
jgi:hypothetical protein